MILQGRVPGIFEVDILLYAQCRQGVLSVIGKIHSEQSIIQVLIKIACPLSALACNFLPNPSTCFQKVSMKMENGITTAVRLLQSHYKYATVMQAWVTLPKKTNVYCISYTKLILLRLHHSYMTVAPAFDVPSCFQMNTAGYICLCNDCSPKRNLPRDLQNHSKINVWLQGSMPLMTSGA